MANLQPSLSIPPSFAGVSPSSPSPIGGGSGGAAVGQVAKDRKMASAEQPVLDLCDPELSSARTPSSSSLKKREIFQDVAPLLWHSFGTVAALLQEIVSTYPALSNPTLSLGASNRVCNALALLQDPLLKCSHSTLPVPVPEYYQQNKPFEYLGLTSLDVIGALVEVDDTEVDQFSAAN